MKIYTVFALSLLFAIVVTACALATPVAGVETPPASQTPLPPTPHENQQPVPAAVLAAQKMLADRLGVAVDTITIREIEETTWPDGCLGLAGPDEMCTEALVDGFRVVFEVNGATIEYRTDRDGLQIRTADSAQPADESSLPGAVLSARQALAQQLGIPTDQIQVVNVEPVEWPNGCLGVEKPGQVCLMMVTPGYRVLFEVGGKQYEFHTDQAGGAVVLATAPIPPVSQTIITWEQTENGVCTRGKISQEGVIYGNCADTMMNGLVQPERLEELRELVTTFASFSGDIPGGKLDFQGEGKQSATEAEQRSIAEWSRLVVQEAQSGSSDASLGQVVVWRRSGGIAGLCSDLILYNTGWYTATNCKNNQTGEPAHYRLKAGQLARLYEWMDRYLAFEYEFTDPAVADAMTTRMTFAGKGKQRPSTEQQEEILQFVAQLYAQAAP